MTSQWRHRGLAALFTVSGSAHFLAPAPFASIVPPFLGAPLPWVWASGVAELACAAGLLAPQPARRRAGLASAALLCVVFPANVYMAVEAFTSDHTLAYRLGTLARLPLQVPLIVVALSIARAADEPRAGQPAASKP